VRILLGLVVLFATSTITYSSELHGIYTKDGIIQRMQAVRDYQLAHPWKETDRNWIRATYYTGVMGLYRATGDPEILAQATRWAEKHKWAEGNERERANKKTCGQTYLELYFLDPVPKRIQKTKAYVDSRIEAIRSGETPTKGWYYCDTLYVGPPTLAMLGKATGDSKYFDYLNEVYWAVAELLYDKEHHFFYRDSRYFDATSHNGRKVFWSRGNGWVLGGLPRILQYLPAENEYYGRYVELFREMSSSIAGRQGRDGLWRSNLDDPNDYPNPETSGTAFFCYAMTWGINSGLLDRDEYLPVVMRAWGGLCRHLHADGKLGYVQPVGGDPQPATSEMTHEYAMGLFLLAGEEMIKLIESCSLTDEQREQYEKECRVPSRKDREG
jgi:unsaturated rhamnogalacturonyl hydrolase